LVGGKQGVECRISRKSRLGAPRFQTYAEVLYDMVYCWIVRFNKEKKVDKVRAYLDTDLLTRAVQENR
jgi:hypothetical protein